MGGGVSLETSIKSIKLVQQRTHFGNEYTIVTAYTEKALNWPALKPEDNKALMDFALFLTGITCSTLSTVLRQPVRKRAKSEKSSNALMRDGGNN